MSRNKSRHRSPAEFLANPRVWESASLNQQTKWFYEDWLLQLSCARFHWEGLPPEIDARFLELTLNGWGIATFFRDKRFDKFFATQATPSGKINIYNNPKSFLSWGADGWHRRLKASQCVPIWNNYTRMPTTIATILYARKLAAIDTTVQVNLANQRHPVLVTCSEAQRLTVENILKQTYGGEPSIVADGASLQGIEIGYVKSDVPYIADKLLKDKARIWAEVMNYLGIDNSPVDKAERVQTAEVESNDNQIEASRCIALDCRRFACEEINRRYKLDVWVDLNTDFSSENFAALMALPSEMVEGAKE